MSVRAILPYVVAALLVTCAAPWAGAEHVAPENVLAYLRGHPLPDGQIFFFQRLPRVFLALLAGGTLAVVGASFQVLFRNPLVEPFTLGISGGASLGAFLVISLPSLQYAVGPVSTVQVFALLGAAATLLMIHAFAQRPEGMNATVLLLAGVTFSILCGGAIMLITYLTNPYRLGVFHRWMMGGLDVVGYGEIASLFPFLLPGLGLLLVHASDLNHLALGEDMAMGQGVDVGTVQRDVFIGGGLATAAVVSMVGPIGFVGLIVPHAVRRLSGFDQRVVLPASLCMGGAALVLCDCIGRTVRAPTELPVGLVTALLGGPLFIALLVRGRHMG